MKLKPKQQEQLSDLSEIVTRNLEVFRAYGAKLHETGVALAKIKALLGPEFHGYCSKTWGFTKDQANRIIHGAKTVAALPIGSAKPANEAQTRALRHIPGELRGEAMDAVSADGKPTAAKLEELAKAALASEDPAAVIRAAREEAVETAARQSADREVGREEKAVDGYRRCFNVALAMLGKAERMEGRLEGLIDVERIAKRRDGAKAFIETALELIEQTAALARAA